MSTTAEIEERLNALEQIVYAIEKQKKPKKPKLCREETIYQVSELDRANRRIAVLEATLARSVEFTNQQLQRIAEMADDANLGKMVRLLPKGNYLLHSEDPAELWESGDMSDRWNATAIEGPPEEALQAAGIGAGEKDVAEE